MKLMSERKMLSWVSWGLIALTIAEVPIQRKPTFENIFVFALAMVTVVYLSLTRPTKKPLQ